MKTDDNQIKNMAAIVIFIIFCIAGEFVVTRVIPW